MRLTSIFVAAYLGLFSAQQPLSQTTPVFRTGVELVRLDVRVLDKTRRPIHGLTAGDFTVRIDSRPQQIATVVEEAFEPPSEPTAPWMRDVAPDVANNAVANARLIVIFLDDALMASDDIAIQLALLEASRHIARAIISSLGPADLAAIVFSRNNQEPQDFTRDHDRLLAAVDRLKWGTMPRELREPYSANTLRNALGYLRAIPDRPSALFYISPGNVNLSSVMWANDEGGGARSARDVNAAAVGAVGGRVHQTSVPVYTVRPNATAGLFPPLGINPSGGPPVSETPRLLAEATGGRVISNTNTPWVEVPALLLETTARYIVAYRPSYPVEDGRYRRLHVHVNRPGVTVEPSDRMMYTPPAAKVPPASLASTPATTHALSDVLPAADEPLRLAVAAFAAPGGAPKTEAAASVTATVGFDVPAETLRGGDTIEIELRVFDGEGRIQIDARQGSVRIAPSVSSDASHREWLTTLRLKPGRYNLRFAMHSTARNKSGSVYTDVIVPDFAVAPITFSGAVVSVWPAPQAMPADAFAALLPIVPTTIRAFGVHDRATAFLRVYWGGGKPVTPVELHAEIRNAIDAVVFTRTDQVTPSPTRSADYRLDLPLATLAPGEYLLTLRTAPPKGAEIRRDVRFVVKGGT